MNLTKRIHNGIVEGFCFIKSCDKKISTANKTYIDMTVSDSGGEANAKIWEYKPELHDFITAGIIVKIRGALQIWQGREQIKVDKIRAVTDEDSVDISQIIPVAPHDEDWMIQKLNSYIDAWEDKDLKALLSYIIQQNCQQIKHAPAAVSLHHTERGGLLHHTLAMLKIADTICQTYTFIDKQLLEAGIILHDIAKIDELYKQPDTGIATGYSAEGTLLGHITMGVIMIDRAAAALNTPGELALLLKHMVLSHHSEPEYGSPVRPMFAEAELLAQIDLMDARMYEIASALSETQKGEFTQKQWSLDNRKLYNHGRGKDMIFSEI